MANSVLMLKKVTFVVIGVALVIISASIGVIVLRFTHNALAADGVVVELNAGGTHPKIEFTTADGRRISYPQGGFIFGARPGDKVRVLYSPDQPGPTTRMDTFGSLWFSTIMPLVLGVIFVLGGATMSSAKPDATTQSG